MPKANILFIQGDQLAARFLRCCGEPVCVVANIDAPAVRNRVFETAHSEPAAEDG